MDPVLLAFLVSIIITVPFFVLDLFVIDKGRDSTIKGSVIAGIVSFFLLWVINWLILYFWRPPIVGPFGGWLWVTFDILIAFICFGIAAVTRESASIGNWVFGIVLVGWLLIAAGMGMFTPISISDGKLLASIANIQEMPTNLYPETDADHILLVPEEAATYKAKQIISQAVDQNGRNLSTVYEPAYGALQSVNNHLYWIFQLKLAGFLISNQVQGIVPGYIAVDAEDPEAEAQVKLGYKMIYTRGAPLGHSLDRYIYNNGYNHWIVDDIIIEVDDNWQPFYTAALSKQALRFKGTVPQKMIIVDPQSGDIQEYALDKIPVWVDRVYSKDVVYNLLDWWGHWGKADWKFMFETATDRMSPAGQPHLVFTKGGHPAWQVQMTSWNNDASTIAIVLFEGRDNVAKVYNVSGIANEVNVLNSFKTTKKNLRNFEPVHPAIHKIYGELTWVVSYITYPTDTTSSSDSSMSKAESFQGLGLLQANKVQGSDVIMEEQKVKAFTAYRQFLANGNANTAPEENSLTKTVEGIVKNIATITIDGNTNYLITLENDNHVFQGVIGENLELPFVKPAIKVAITYLDIGKTRVDIKSYDDLSLSISP